MLRPFLRRAREGATSARRHKGVFERLSLPFRTGGRHVFLLRGRDAEHRQVAIAMVREIAVDEDPAPDAHLVEARQRIHRIALGGAIELQISEAAQRRDSGANGYLDFLPAASSNLPDRGRSEASRRNRR
jgi:hypothetical protein